MRRKDIRWAVLRIEGTNSEDESAACMREVGVQAEIVHLKQFLGDDVPKGERRKLSDYDGLWIAGGFSAGDYIRAGAILAARIKSRMAPEFAAFIRSGKPMLGICNGFQVMVELGVLPSLDRKVPMTEVPSAVLHLNDSGHYECRPSLLRHVSKGTCKFTSRIPRNEVRTVISSHAEGKFLMASEAEYRRLVDQDQVVFTYTDPDGSDDPDYPWSPNGAPHAIAGVCNPEGTVFGMMPHPERVFFRRGHPDWTRTGLDAGRGFDVGDGRDVFESIVEYQEKRL
jgi:phosphoribosylformylglycinamidine synthase subunit PurQ / glutaminase